MTHRNGPHQAVLLLRPPDSQAQAAEGTVSVALNGIELAPLVAVHASPVLAPPPHATTGGHCVWHNEQAARYPSHITRTSQHSQEQPLPHITGIHHSTKHAPLARRSGHTLPCPGVQWHGLLCLHPGCQRALCLCSQPSALTLHADRNTVACPQFYKDVHTKLVKKSTHNI